MINERLLWWTKLGFLTLSVGVMMLVVIGLYKALKKTHYSATRKKNILLGTIAFSVFWVSIVSILSAKGFFLDFSTIPPRMFLVLLLPLVKILYLTFSGRMDHLLAVIPEKWLLNAQVFRVPVEILLWLLLLSGVFPEHLTLEGRNWDILAGLLSPVVAYLCFVKKSVSAKVAIVWNFMGLGLLLNIVIMAVLTFPTPFQVFDEGVSNIIVAEFPVIFLPAILVTAAYTFHAFSLRQLWCKSKTK